MVQHAAKTKKNANKTTKIKAIKTKKSKSKSASKTSKSPKKSRLLAGQWEFPNLLVPALATCCAKAKGKGAKAKVRGRVGVGLGFACCHPQGKSTRYVDIPRVNVTCDVVTPRVNPPMMLSPPG